MAALSVSDALAKQWWVWLVRGILAVLFSIMAFAWPSLTLMALVLLFGVYALMDGLVVLWVGAGARAWWLAITGVLGVIIGIYTFIYPGITTVALVYLIAVWAILRGLLEITAAIQLRREISGGWALIIAGILAIFFGAVLVARPSAGALAMVWLIGTFAFLFGVMMIVLAVRARALPGRIKKLVQEG